MSDDVAPPEREHREDRAPERPGELGRDGWQGAIKRTLKEYKVDNLRDWAAALTYYGVLSIFPALLVVVSAIGLTGHSATQSLLNNIGQVAPSSVRQVLVTAIANLQNSQRSAGVIVVVSLLAALWSASGYVAAFMRAANTVYDMPEGRPIWIKLPVRVGVTAVLLVLLAASAVAVVLTGGLADRAASVLGIGHTATMVWNVAKWPALVVLVSLMLAILYWAAPNVRHPRFRWITPGSVLSVFLWIIASAAFAFYVANFGSYNKTYGTLAGVVIFLVWLWLSNIAVLLGVELDAELQRGRAIQAGHPPEKEPYVEPRSTRKFPDR